MAKQKFMVGEKIWYMSLSGNRLTPVQAMIQSVSIKENIIYYTMGAYPKREDELFGSREECIDFYIDQLQKLKEEK